MEHSISIRRASAGDAAVVEAMPVEAARWVEALGVVMNDQASGGAV